MKQKEQENTQLLAASIHEYVLWLHVWRVKIEEAQRELEWLEIKGD